MITREMIDSKETMKAKCPQLYVQAEGITFTL
nr:MAG TPA: hypothetical protein [Caudoviricetes sp.]